MRWFLIVLGALILFPYLAWKTAYPTYSHRFRLALEFETAEGLKTGSSVIEVSRSDIPGWINEFGAASAPRATGEAVLVDLGRGRHVIGLLLVGPTENHSAVTALSFEAFNDVLKMSGTDNLYKTMTTLTGKRILPPDLLPHLITLRDKSDPLSAVLLTPDDVPKVLGADVKFIRAWIELTKDSVTSTLKNHLPAIVDSKNWSEKRFGRQWGSYRTLSPARYMFIRD